MAAVELTERDQQILDGCPQRGTWFRAGTHRSFGSDLPYRLGKLHRLGLLERKLSGRGSFNYYLYNRVHRAAWVNETCPACKGHGGRWETQGNVNIWIAHGCLNCKGAGTVKTWNNFVEPVSS